MKRILIIKMWALGDILMATPMIAALHARDPGIKVIWVAEAAHSELLAAHPGIDEVIAFDSGAWRRLLKRGKILVWLAQGLALLTQMRRHRFDAVINCQPEKWWSAIMCAAPIRVGLYPTDSLPASKWFYTKALGRPRKPAIHNTEHYLMATEALGCRSADRKMTLGETPDEAVFWQEFCLTHGIDPGRGTVVLAPFSNGLNRCWEPQRYALLAERLYHEQNMQIIMTFASSDRAAAEEIRQQADAPVVLAEGTRLRQYISLLRHADLVVSGDSSPMHIAAAVDTPFVALFGPTPMGERAPLAGRGSILFKPLPCAPCDSPVCANPVFRQCMQMHSVQDVLDAADALLPMETLG